MRVFGSNDFSCILVLKDKAVCLFPFFELLSSHSQFFSVYVSILFRLNSLVVGLLLSFCLYFSVPAYVCLFLSLLNLLLLYVSHLSLHISLCTACIICLTVSLPFLSLWLSASCFASRSLFISLPYFFVSPFWFFFSLFLVFVFFFCLLVTSVFCHGFSSARLSDSGISALCVFTAWLSSRKLWGLSVCVANGKMGRIKALSL